MASYLVRRVLQAILTIFIAISMVFFIFALLPGDPAQLYAGEEASLEYLQLLHQRFGLDDPIGKRYFNFIKGLFTGDLGTSFFTGNPVTKTLIPRAINSAMLALAAFPIVIIVGVTTGIIAGTHKGTIIETATKTFVLLGISIPSFVTGILLMYLFGIKLGILPVARMTSWKSFILPAMNLGITAAFVTRTTRSLLLEVLLEDYIRTAYGKGLTRRVVILKHALRNILVPLITVIGMRMGYLLAGALITENLFSWPGMGRLIVSAITRRDFPLIRGALLYMVAVTLSISLIIDFLYGVVNPKVRYG